MSDDLALGAAVNDALMGALSPYHRHLVTRGDMCLEEALADQSAWRERQAEQLAAIIATRTLGPPGAVLVVDFVCDCDDHERHDDA